MSAPDVRPLFALYAYLAMGTPGLAADADQWKAGTAKVAITPREPVSMAGYAGRSGPFAGVLTDLHARALPLEDAAGNRIAVVTMDLIEIPNALHNAIVGAAASFQVQQPSLARTPRRVRRFRDRPHRSV